MAALRYVCLSDLHLGADYSLLTATDASDRVDLSVPSETLSAMAAALRRLVPALSGATPPTLILLGDALDMGLSPLGAVARAFERFVDAMWPDDAAAVFDRRVVCLPGNHDHHLWRMAQDHHFLQTLAQRPAPPDPTAWVPDLLQHTTLFPPADTPPVQSAFLTNLMRGYDRLCDARVDVAYPNLGLIDADRRRCIVLHHGHYVDATYRAMSLLNDELAGRGRRALSVAQIEQENGAWVDFLWSDLGSAGTSGEDAMTLYETMRDAAASRRLSQRAANRMLGLLESQVGIGGKTQTVQGITVAQIVRGLADAVLVRGAESPRDSDLCLMTPDEVADLRWYVGGPVRKALAQALRDPRLMGAAPSQSQLQALELSFVFGHTHKPFEDELPVAGFDAPMAVFNTGGWVVDQPTMSHTQGAAAVFIDDELNVASLRLFNDPVNGTIVPVHARGVGGFRDRDNAMLAALGAALPASAAAWAVFSDSVRRAAERQAARLLRRASMPEPQPEVDAS